MEFEKRAHRAVEVNDHDDHRAKGDQQGGCRDTAPPPVNPRTQTEKEAREEDETTLDTSELLSY